MDDVAVPETDESVDGIIHRDENTNSCVLISFDPMLLMMFVMLVLEDRQSIVFCRVIVVQSRILVVPKTNRKQ